MKCKIYFIAAIFLAAFTADSFAQLTKIWDRSNEGFELARFCPPGKLAVVAKNGVNQFLVDLTNGQTIHSTIYPEAVYFNYWGDRYYVHNITENVLREYDIKTKEFVRIAKYLVLTTDSSVFDFNYNHNSLLFYNANSGVLLDSFKIPGSPDEPLYSLSQGLHQSKDARYLAFHLQLKNKPTQNNFFLYDRQTREIIMQKALPANNDLLMQFFNTSNLMAYAENIKLPEDDKAYSYIRIYDPDKREVVKNLKLTEIGIKWFLLKNDDSYLLYQETGSNNTIFFNLNNQEKSDFIISNVMGPMYIDDTLYVTSLPSGYTFDWNAVSVEEEPNPNIPVIYPNPTTNIINLNIEPKYYNGNWNLTDLNGRIMMQGTVLSIPSLQINIGVLPAQNYLLQLRKDNFTVTYNVIKM